MLTFLSDPPMAVYMVLVLAVIVTGGLWFSSRDRRSLLAFGAALLLLGLIVLMDFCFESPREEAVRQVQEMVKAANDRNREAFVSHVAPTFEYQGDGGHPRVITRDELLHSDFWNVLAHHNVTVAAWDFDRADVTEPSNTSIEIGFLASGKADGKQIPMYLRARFSRQPNGEMKLTALSSYDPLKRVNERTSIPNFP